MLTVYLKTAVPKKMLSWYFYSGKNIMMSFRLSGGSEDVAIIGILYDTDVVIEKALESDSVLTELTNLYAKTEKPSQ